MKNEISKSNWEYIGMIFLISFTSLMVLGILIFAINQKVNEGCWILEFDDVKGIETFEIDNYSCEELREMILLEIFPKEIYEVETIYSCDGGKAAMYYGAEQVFERYTNKDYYKREYQENCFGKNSQTSREENK